MTDYSDSNLARVEWRSVEHNTDLASAFQSLANLTGDSAWAERANHARRFVESPRLYDCREGFWYLGTTAGLDINTSPLAEDTATWLWLAEIRPCGDAALTWALSVLRTTSNGFDGIRFSNAGDGVVAESTAHLALALQFAGNAEAASRLLQTPEAVRTNAPDAEGHEIVATPVPGNGVTSGLGARYYASPHVASTAWTILALTGTNPFAPVTA